MALKIWAFEVFSLAEAQHAFGAGSFALCPAPVVMYLALPQPARGTCTTYILGEASSRSWFVVSASLLSCEPWNRKFCPHVETRTGMGESWRVDIYSFVFLVLIPPAFWE